MRRSQQSSHPFFACILLNKSASARVIFIIISIPPACSVLSYLGSFSSVQYLHRSHQDEIRCGFLSEVYCKFSACCLFIPCVQIFLKFKSFVFFIRNLSPALYLSYFILHLIHLQQIPLCFVKLHSLLKKFFPKYYYSSAGKALSAMLKGLHAIRTSAVVCNPLSTFKATFNTFPQRGKNQL